MDDPTFANESRFWDDVAGWVLDAREYGAADLTDAGIESLLRDQAHDADSA